MRIIVGLWNPEPRYAGTRHNVGAEVVQTLAERWGLRLKRRARRVKAHVARGEVGEVDTVLALPNVSMNVSGPATAAVLRTFGASVEDLLIVHDDIDLPFGRLRLHRGRGAGGHNGVRSVVAFVGSRDFYRLKLGVGRPPGTMDPAEYVLRRFDRTERPEVDRLVEDAADVVERFLVDPEDAVRLASERKPSS